MEMFTGYLFYVLVIVCSIAVWYIYHKIFAVVYFDLMSGCLKEILGSLFVGGILAVLIITFWYVSIPLVILFIIALVKKN